MERFKAAQVKKVTLCSKAMRKMHDVTNVVTIKSARVPIVKFTHVPTGISSDVSFKNAMSVNNTKFIRTVVEKLDGRIKPLMMTLR